MRARVMVIYAVLAMLLAGCGGTSEDPAPASAPASAPTSAPTASSTPDENGFDPALRDELLLMLERDQGRRLSTAPEETSDDRQERLAEIFDQHGWPGFDLVGRRAGTAAWAIAQHADLDPDFQARALRLLRAAVDEGQASRGNLAYLEDRVTVADGRPQSYGTQIGCTPDGPRPSTPIRNRAGVDQRRKAAGLDPLADYLDEMTTLCAQGG